MFVGFVKRYRTSKLLKFNFKSLLIFLNFIFLVKISSATEQVELITFAQLSHAEEIKLKTKFLKRHSEPETEAAIKKALTQLGFVKEINSIYYEKKFPFCETSSKLAPVECIVRAHIYYFVSDSYSVFDITFTSDEKDINTPSLYESFFNLLTKNQ